MNRLKKVILLSIFLLFSACIISVDASIKEDSSEYTSNVYIMGGTKFTKTVTAKRAFDAGRIYKDLKEEFYDIYDDLNDKIYMYSKTFKKWYVVPEEGGALESVNSEEEEMLENDLYVFYVNNDVKMLEYTTNRVVDEGSYDSESGVNYNEDTKTFTFPATLTRLYYSSNNNYIFVDTIYDTDSDEFEYGNFFEPYLINAFDYDTKRPTTTYFTDENGYVPNFFDPVYVCEGSGDESECFSKVVLKYVDEDGNDLGDISKIKFSEDTTVYQVLGGTPVIEVDGTYYEEKDLGAAIEKSYYDEENPENSVPAYLLDDLEVENLITLSSSNKNMYLDLYHSTLSRKSGGSVIYLTGTNSSLYITDGYIENETGNAITAGVVNEKTEQNISLYIEDDVQISTKKFGVVTFGAGVTLDFAGSILLAGEGAVGISGNGYDKVNSEINILPDAFIFNGMPHETDYYEDTIGVYLPQKAVLNVNNAHIVASTAFAMKSGTLNIAGGYYNGNGTKTPAEVNNNGTVSTGDVIYVELNKNYADDVKINIDDTASLQSSYSNVIQVFNPEAMDLPEISYANTSIIKYVDGNNLFYLYDAHALDAAIEVGNTYYSENNIKEAIESSSVDNIAYLLKNVTLTSLLTLDKKNTDMYFDLRNFTLDRDNGGYVIYQTGEGSKLHINNGTIRNTSGQAITAGSFDNKGENQNIYLEVGPNLYVYTSNIGVVAYGNGVTLDFEGSIYLQDSEAVGISGNGMDRESGVINVKNGAQIHSQLKPEVENNTFAFYFPQKGTVNIEGGFFNAGTVIGIKAGTLNITGGDYTALGNKNEPKLNNNGIDSTGDVIYVEMNEGYADNIEINISDASLSSTNGQNILVYNPTGMDEPEINTHYNVFNDGDKTYYGYTFDNLSSQIQVGSNYYTKASYKAAFDASSQDSPAYILSDLTIEDDFTIKAGSHVVINSEVTLEVLGDVVIEEGANLIVEGTLKYGTETTIDGKVTMFNGNIFDEVPIAGPANAAYITTDAVFDLEKNGDITIVSGLVQLGMSFKTMPGQNLVLKPGAVFIIPSEYTLYVYSNLTIESGAEFQVEGTLDLTNAESISGIEIIQGSGTILKKDN